MRQLNEIARAEESMSIIVELSSAFESIASIRISQTKDKVLQSTEFFRELWNIYRQLRVENVFNFGRPADNKDVVDKDLYVIITAEGGFSGDIDLLLIRKMLERYDKAKNDIIVIGHHGAIELAQRGVEYKKYFKLPVTDKNINTMPIVREVQKYRSTTVFYQEYITLLHQEVRSIEVQFAINARAKDSDVDVINEKTYIFEPDAYSVAAHLERSMMQIAISQLILNSKLAQYASRFRATSASRERSTDEKAEIHLEYNRTKRALKDERLKEMIGGLKKSKLGAMNQWLA